VLLKPAPDRFRLSIADSDPRLHAQGLVPGRGLDAEAFGPDVHPLAVQGPKAEAVMAALFGGAIRGPRFFGLTPAEFAGARRIVSRSGCSAGDGFEIHLADGALGPALRDEVTEAGRPHAIAPGGPNLIDRIEGGHLGHGDDMTAQNDPLEMGLDRLCRLDGAIDCSGLPAWRLVPTRRAAPSGGWTAEGMSASAGRIGGPRPSVGRHGAPASGAREGPPERVRPTRREERMRHFTTSVAAAAALALAGPVAAQDAGAMVEELHFLVPGGAGGGWDGTARGTGEALTESGLLGDATYENMSGGGGGRAIAHLIETGDPGTIMVNSTPIVIRSLQGVFPQSFRDLTPVASVIGDYATLVVGKDSEIAEFQGLVDLYREDPNAVAIGGGSVQGGMDHIVAALVMQAAGADPIQVKYIPYDTGGPAMAALLSGEIQALSTGLSEAIELARQDEVDILCVTAPERVDAVPDVPTCAEAGAAGVEFVNWRGFFAAPDIPEERVESYRAALEAMYETEAWAEVRDRNGWVEIWNPGQEFTEFLEAQETQIGDLMRELGFL
jgi:putative tricarboxylic transport membrane protein